MLRKFADKVKGAVAAVACASMLVAPMPAIAQTNSSEVPVTAQAGEFNINQCDWYFPNGSRYAYTGAEINPDLVLYLDFDKINGEPDWLDDLFYIWDSEYNWDFDYDYWLANYYNDWADWGVWTSGIDDFGILDGKHVYFLDEGVDYIVTYVNNIQPGVATADVDGLGAFAGSYTSMNYEIVRDGQTTTSFDIRLAGSTRYDTMAKIVEAASGLISTNVAVLANGQNFPDALAASAVAHTLNAYIILTTQGSLSGQAQNVINRYGITEVHIMGGEAAVSKNVENSLKAQGLRVSRISGVDRVGTSLEALRAAYDYGSNSNTVVIATGYNFADSLSISPYSYAYDAPIVLTQADKTLSQAALNALSSNPIITNAIIVGGNAAVSNAVENQLASIGISSQRLQGATRYETSARIAEFEVDHGFRWAQPIIATGRDFPDALAGAPLAGANDSVILLANNTGDATVSAFAANKGEIRVGSLYYVLGGVNAVSDNLVKFLNNTLS